MPVINSCIYYFRFHFPLESEFFFVYFVSKRLGMKISYKNFLSEYELKNVVWVGIEYDKEKLINFINRYEQLRIMPKTDDSIEELRVMEKIFKSRNKESLEKLLNNDTDYSRWAVIEKFSRKAATEILLDGKYSKETFSSISNLPIVDFKLVVKRTKELIKIIKDVINESDMDTSKIPGTK